MAIIDKICQIEIIMAATFQEGLFGFQYPSGYCTLLVDFRIRDETSVAGYASKVKMFREKVSRIDGREP